MGVVLALRANSRAVGEGHQSHPQAANKSSFVNPPTSLCEALRAGRYSLFVNLPLQNPQRVRQRERDTLQPIYFAVSCSMCDTIHMINAEQYGPDTAFTFQRGIPRVRALDSERYDGAEGLNVSQQ